MKRRSLAERYLRSTWAVVLPRLASWEDRWQPSVSLRGSGRVAYGLRTYWSPSARFIAYGEADRIEIGNYCSIGPGVHVLAGGNHDLDKITTYPLQIVGSGCARATPPVRTCIGNDVWIGTNAILVGNVVIGHGSVIGAGSVVTADIPAYAVAVGSPARVVRYRLSSDVRQLLLDIRWWDWPEDVVLECAELLQSPDPAQLVAYAVRHGLVENGG